MRVFVTQQEISMGRLRSPAGCAIALSLGPRLPVCAVRVDDDGVVRLYAIAQDVRDGKILFRGFLAGCPVVSRVFTPLDLIKEIKLPEVAVTWMRHHDATGEGRPFDFEIAA